MFELVNSRNLAVRVNDKSKFTSLVDLLWNLQTLIIYCLDVLTVPAEIWKLHQLRHLESQEKGLILPDPPSGDNDIVIMKNLQTLKRVQNLILNEVVKRIPNVKKLHVRYNVKQMEGEKCLSYLQCLSKLENFHCSTYNECDEYWQMIRFPHSLKMLHVYPSSELELEEIMPKIGSLPNLEKFGFFKTGRWETIEGQFESLKCLKLAWCQNLEDWIVSDKTHFPVLQKLCLTSVDQLKEIPSIVGDIDTMKSIFLLHCSESAVVSAKNIADDQEDFNGDLHVRVEVKRGQDKLLSLASSNFEVGVLDLSRGFEELLKRSEDRCIDEVISSVISMIDETIIQ